MKRENSKRLVIALAIAGIAVLTTGCGPNGNPGFMNNPLNSGAPGMLAGGCMTAAQAAGPISVGYQGQASGGMSGGMGMVSGFFQTSGAGAVAPAPAPAPTYPNTGYPYNYNYGPVTLSGTNVAGSTINMIIQTGSNFANGTLTLNGNDVQMLKYYLFPYASMPMPTTGYGYNSYPTYPTSPYGGYGSGYGYNQQACVTGIQVQLNIASGNRLYMGTVGLNFSTGQQFPVNF